MSDVKRKDVLPASLDSYQELRKLSLKGRKFRCDCIKKHESKLSSVVRFLYSTVSSVFALDCLFKAIDIVSGHHYVPYVSVGLLLVAALVLGKILDSLRQRNSLAAHEDRVLTQRIPDYLVGQIFSIQTSLISGDSPFGQIEKRLWQVIKKAEDEKRALEQFLSAQSERKDIVSHWERVSQEVNDHLSFQEALVIVEDGYRLVRAFLASKRAEVVAFEQSLRNVDLLVPSAAELMAKGWLSVAQRMFTDMAALRKRFNNAFASSGLASALTPTQTSHEATKCASVFFSKLSESYPNFVSRPIPFAEVSQQSVESKAETEIPVVSVDAEEKPVIEDSLSEEALEGLEKLS